MRPADLADQELWSAISRNDIQKSSLDTGMY
jgi:hypothetical protein